MNKKIIILFALLTISSCIKVDESYKPPNYIKYLKEVERETIQELKKKGLYISGIGSASMDCISLVDLSFNYNKLSDIAKARELLVLAAEILLTKINSHEKIRPDLCNYPFNISNIELSLDFKKNDKIIKNKRSKIVNFVTLGKGIIKYKYCEPSNYIFETLLEESFEEAKEKVENGSKATSVLQKSQS